MPLPLLVTTHLVDTTYLLTAPVRLCPSRMGPRTPFIVPSSRKPRTPCVLTRIMLIHLLNLGTRILLTSLSMTGRLATLWVPITLRTFLAFRFRKEQGSAWGPHVLLCRKPVLFVPIVPVTPTARLLFLTSYGFVTMVTGVPLLIPMLPTLMMALLGRNRWPVCPQGVDIWAMPLI